MVKVKLVIAEIAKSGNEKKFRRIFSPIATNLHMMGDFGWFHSALVIGPWYIEWNSSGLCIPRKCYSSAALLAIDVGTPIKNKVKLKEMIDKLAGVIVRWNTTKEYSQKSANCQHFVDDICKEIGLNLEFSGAMGGFIKELRSSGKSSLQWKIPEKIREECNIKEEKIKFQTHEELDKFVQNIYKHIPLFHEKHKSDYRLLKSFDRAFWLRHFRNNIHTDYLPLYNEDQELDCPFGNPQESASLYKAWW